MWDAITYQFTNINRTTGTGLDNYFRFTLYYGSNYLSTLGLKLNHFNKRGPCRVEPCYFKGWSVRVNWNNCSFLISLFMMTSSNGNNFRFTGLFCGEFTGHRWISRTKGQWCGALMFSLIYGWNESWANSGDADDLQTLPHSFWHHCNIKIQRDLLSHICISP